MTLATKRIGVADSPFEECGQIARHLFLTLRKSTAAARVENLVLAAISLQAISDHLAHIKGLTVTENTLIEAALNQAGGRLPAQLFEDARRALIPFRSFFKHPEDLGRSWEALYGILEEDSQGIPQESNAKRDHGVYYTPKDLANFLTEATLSSVVQGLKSARNLLDICILDPAVGSGFFLIAAHRFLVAQARGCGDVTDVRNLSTEIGKTCLYGVDRDPIAAAVAKVALWLEIEDPQLSVSDLSNVRSGDALVSVHGSSIEGLALLKDLKGAGFRPFEWRSAFPGVFGRKGKGGFDVVLSNPPWGKIKADAREFFTRLHPEVSRVQGASRKDFIGSTLIAEKQRRRYMDTLEELRQYVELLRSTPGYKAAFGVSSDIDYYTLFIQRSFELIHETARLGLLIPGAFVRSAGTALIRREFFRNGETEHLLEFENRERLFPIHGMFKFLLWTFSRGSRPGIRKAIFGLRSVDEARAELSRQTRTVSFSSAFLARVSKEWLSVPELRDEKEKRLFAKLHALHPPLGEHSEAWNVRFIREVDMTNDSHSFIDASTKSAHDEQHLLPLYEGRMVHQFDSVAKGYLSGHGRQAKWEPLPYGTKVIRPHYYVSDDTLAIRKPRAGFCDITGNANERTVLAALIPEFAVCGNKVPVCEFDSADLRLHLLWIAIANSFVIDWVVRRRISTTLNFFHWKQIPFPRLEPDSALGRHLWLAAAQLSMINSPKLPSNKGLCQLLAGARVRPKELTMIERAEVRADIDARIAFHFGLDAEDFAYLLTDFPTLDRSQPSLKDGKRHGKAQCTLTRDISLLRFYELKRQDPTKVSVPWCTARHVDLRQRVRQALTAGCVPYVPSQLAARMFK